MQPVRRSTANEMGRRTARTVVGVLAAVTFAVVVAVPASARPAQHEGSAAPTLVSGPTISGRPVSGEPIYGSAGRWRDATRIYVQWQIRRGPHDRWKALTARRRIGLKYRSRIRYLVPIGDLRATFRVRVLAINAKGMSSVVSRSTRPVAVPAANRADLAPRNIIRPALLGQAAANQTLTIYRGYWSSSPVSFAYSWKRCSADGTGCTSISGATQKTYTIPSGDAGDTIVAQVVATNATGSKAALTRASAVITDSEPAPVNTAAPSLSGTAVEGDVLTVSNGTWSNSPTSYTYAWRDCVTSGGSCTAIAGATSSTYTLQSSDVGQTIEAAVTAANSTGSASATSNGVVVSAASSGGPPDGIKVDGSKVVNDAGEVLHLHGVNRSGTEYACIQGWGIFDGPGDAASVAAMASWHINVVRIPLNEDCWLGINGAEAAYSGANYINAIVSYVNLLHQYGMYAELSLMWAAPGTAQATYQSAAPDEDHSPAMWASMASTFKGDHNVILAPWGETTVDWQCFMQGCNDEATYATGPWDGDSSCGTGCYYYTTAGMDQAVTVMRGAGYSGPIAIPCVDYANTCADPTSGGAYEGGTWLTEHPSDPDGQLIAEAHIYGGQLCSTTTCLNVSIAPILAGGYPVIFGETGPQNGCSSTSDVASFMTWADENDVGYEAWAWDTDEGCDSLISAFDDTPSNPYGTYVQSHYATLAAEGW